MKSDYERMFDSLQADEQQLQNRIDRIKQSGGDAPAGVLRIEQYAARKSKLRERRPAPENSITKAAARRPSAGAGVAPREGRPAATAASIAARTAPSRFFASRRGIAALTASIILILAVCVAVPLGIWYSENVGMYGALRLLKDTYVDMTDIAAFGIWQAGSGESLNASARPKISNVSAIKASSNTEEEEEDDDGWDDELYDWESDYDWDPSKADVLISINDDGKIEEVVYERTNGRGQVRQSKLGHAVKTFVSKGFTYVMYVDDDTWERYDDLGFAAEIFHHPDYRCHHEREQTVVIHNETGKVFALNDIFPQVNEYSGAVNHVLSVDPFKDDTIHIKPFYGNYKHQWYNVRFDEVSQTIKYELVIDKELIADKSYNVFAVKRDKYGQQYLLARSFDYGQERVSAGIVNLPHHRIHGNSLIFEERNGFHLGTDGQVYVFDNGVLKVFGDKFKLEPVSPDTEVAFEGIADSYTADSLVSLGSGISYTLSSGYLFSMFGEVWKIGDDGSMTARDRLEGSFPRYADDGHLIGGEIIAFVDTSLLSIVSENQYSVNGRMVQLKFDGYTEESPSAKFIHIISANEMSYFNMRMMVQQNKNPYSMTRGDTKYFLITVADGKPIVEYFAYGYNGGVTGLVNPITEPLVQ